MTLSWLFHHTLLVLSFLRLCLQSTHFIPKFSFTHSYFLMPSFLSLQLETWPSRKNSWVACKSSAIILSCPLPLRNMSCFVPKPTSLFLSQPLGPPLWFFSLSQFPPLVWLHFCLWHLFLSYWADIGSQNNSYEKFISLETVNSPPLLILLLLLTEVLLKTVYGCPLIPFTSLPFSHQPLAVCPFRGNSCPLNHKSFGYLGLSPLPGLP